jgi:hypothetical protein
MSTGSGSLHFTRFSLSQVPLRANNEDEIETLPQSSVERIMQLQMKQMQVMQSLTKQFS